MSCLYIMIGIPGSGKSTFASEVFKDKAEIVSTDALREELLGDASNQSYGDEIFKEAYKRIADNISKNKDVCFDATNINRKSRKRLFEFLRSKKLNPEISAIVMNTPIAQCLYNDCYREMKGERFVGKEVIHKFISKFQLPEFSEGFNSIFLSPHDFTNDYKEYVKELENLDLYLLNTEPHNNPHHEEPINAHMFMAEDYVRRNYPKEKLLITAARYHDIGKYLSKQEKEHITHYYNHENYGAYMWLSSIECQYRNSFEKRLIAFLIQEHDRWPSLGEKKRLDFYSKVKNEFKDINIIKYLNILYKADKHATIFYI